ncbi:MAG: hypothetical protein RL226_1321 [Bacteroidota bacterium]
MRRTLLAFLLSAPALTFAQPVITASQLIAQPNISVVADSLNWMDMSNMGGPNQTWDFSDLTTLNINYTYNWVTPASVPGGNLFPSANVATSVEGVQFFNNITSTEYLEAGYYLETEGSTLMETYSNPSTRFALPLTYMNSGTDNFSSTITFDGDILFTSSGTTTWDVIGYGTLILPEGSFTDVLLLHAFESSTDVQDFEGLQFVTNVSSTTYAFMKANNPFPLMVFDQTTTANDFFSETSQGGLLFGGNQSGGGGGTSVVESSLIGINAYPNPTSEQLHFQFGNMQPTEMTLRSLDGKEVMRFNENVPSSINVANLASGIYFVDLKDNQSTTSLKFVKL